MNELMSIPTLVQAIVAHEKPALCLDFDGTLVDIAARPDAICIDPRLPVLLHGLKNVLDGRLALITGRSFADLSRYLELIAFHVASSHGAQFSAAGDEATQNLADGAELDDWRAWITTRITGFDGVWLEDKETSLAIHTRQNPDVHDQLFTAVQTELADDTVINALSGNGVVEVRIAMHDKGTALESLMQLSGWHGCVPVMIGDDTTDNDAMRVASKSGGFGIQIGHGPKHKALLDAKFALSSVDETHKLLHLLTKALESPENAPP